MNNNVKKLVRKKKKKKIVKKIVLGFFVLIIGIVIFIYKAPIFNLKKIYFNGLVTLTNESLQEDLKYNIGQNIFTIDYSKIEKNLKDNPYIKEVKVSKKGINKIRIDLVENNIAYYAESNGKIKSINNEGVITEEIESLDGRILTKLTGIDLVEKKVGDKITEEYDLPQVLDTFYKMIEVMPEEFRFSEINISDLNDIVCYIGDVEIILGDNSNLINKVNMALNLIEQGNVSKGYIDMSFDGPPVIKQNE